MLALASLSLALLAAVGFLLVHPVGGFRRAANLQAALRDPEVRARVVREILKSNPAFFDSHPDPAVARVMIPRLEGVQFYDVPVSTNEWGMRERSYALPKPAGTVRVVLLGDSYVFGNGARAEDRMGVFLERELAGRAAAGFQGRIEVLHIGIGSWNTIAECTFVRRQLSELAPDLVVQLFIYNDLDDNSGVRGFGVRSDFDPLHSERANSMVQATYAEQFLTDHELNGLLYGQDFESLSRLAANAAEIARLARAVERSGGEYLFLAGVAPWILQPLLPALEAALRPEQIASVEERLLLDHAYWTTETDAHWNRRGHEQAALLLYGLIQGRGYLSELALSPWSEATQYADSGQAQRLTSARTDVIPPPVMSTRLEFDRQVCGGLDLQRNASPYVSVSLYPEHGRALVVTARCYERPEIDGGTVQVFVDETQVGAFRLAAGQRIESSFEIPEELAARKIVSVRLLADDWIYAGTERRNCHSYVLEAVEFRP